MISGDFVNKREKSSTSIIYTGNILKIKINHLPVMWDT